MKGPEYHLSSLTIEDARLKAIRLANETGNSVLIYQHLLGEGFGTAFTLPLWGESVERIYPNV